MHVHVDRRRIALEKHERERIAPLRQRLVIALDQRVVERAAVDRPLVDEHDHLVPRRAPHSRPADQAAQAQARLHRLERHERLRGLPAENLRDALGQRRCIPASGKSRGRPRSA